MNQALMQDALRLRRAGRLSEAAAVYGEILRAEPHHFEALHALGILRFQAGKLDEAERLIGEAVLVNPQAPEAFYNRGSLLLKLNRPEEALNAFAAALALKPDYAEAMGNRGSALMQLGRYADASADFSGLARLKPQLPQAWVNHAGALVKLTRYEEAHASYGRALNLRPDDAEARKNRGAVALLLGKVEDALGDAEHGLARNTSDAAFWALRANALAELNRRDEAAASYDRALSLQPAQADVLYNRANNLLALRRYGEAAEGYEQTLRIVPNYPYAQGAKGFSKLCSCDWQNLDAERVAVAECVHRGIAVTPYHVLVLTPSPADAFAAATFLSAEKYPPSAAPLWNGEIYSHEKIRLAYISANFHDHAVSRLMAGVFEHHDRARFEISAMSLGPGDAGPMRGRLVEAFDRFIDVPHEPAARIAERLRQMEVDIAVDLMGFTEGCRPDILRLRPAPVQVNYLGYPGTLGAAYVDYIVADPVVLPQEQFAFYAENVVHLPHSYLPGGAMRTIAERAPSRSEAGLPENGFVFCCFNHFYKITPELFEIWMRLLRQVEKSVLWLSSSDARAMANLKHEAQARGVHPDRLVFAPFAKRDEDHLARLQLADLFLDTLPYNAHATASDALWAGVPVLTAMGQGFPGRVGASLLRATGLEEMIAPSLSLYESMALEIAGNSDALSILKTKLARNREQSALFDTARFTRDLESAFVAMWARHQGGLPPKHFAVERLP
jgi:protein O-GlcNAc transferase